MSNEFLDSIIKSLRALLAGIAGGITVTFYEGDQFFGYTFTLILVIVLLLVFEYVGLKAKKM